MSRSPTEAIRISQLGNIDFLLKEVLVDPKYKKGGGNTKAHWTTGCFGTLMFIPWDGFEGIVHNGMKAVERLCVEEVKGAVASLEEARFFIDQARKDHEWIERMEFEKFRREEAQLKASQEASPGQKRTFQEVETAQKVQLEIPYIMKPVTNSISVSELHSDVMRGILKLLRNIYNRELIRMESSKCSSESMRVADSNEYPAAKEYIGIPIPENQTPDQSLYRVTTKDDALIAIPVCCFEFKGPSPDVSGIEKA